MADHQHTVNRRLVTDRGRTVTYREANGKHIIDISPGGQIDGKLIMSPTEWERIYRQAGLQPVPTVPVPVPGKVPELQVAPVASAA